jgi:hypothetical protein
MHKLIIIGLFLTLISCSETFTQSYSDYEEFVNSHEGQKSWFYDLIANDSSDIKEIHNIDNNNSFGRFSYRESPRIILILLDTITFQQIPPQEAVKFISRISIPNRPSWFVANTEILDCLTYKSKNFILIHKPSDKSLYFATNPL